MDILPVYNDKNTGKGRMALYNQFRMGAQKDSAGLRTRANFKQEGYEPLFKSNRGVDDRDFDIIGGELVFREANKETPNRHGSNVIGPAGPATFSSFNNAGLLRASGKTEEEKKQHLIENEGEFQFVGVALTPAPHHTRERAADDVVDYSLVVQVENLGKGMDRTNDRSRRLNGVPDSKMLPLLKPFRPEEHRVTNRLVRSLAKKRAMRRNTPGYKRGRKTYCSLVDDAAEAVVDSVTAMVTLGVRMCLDAGIVRPGQNETADDVTKKLANEFGLTDNGKANNFAIRNLPTGGTKDGTLLFHLLGYLYGTDKDSKDHNGYSLTNKQPNGNQTDHNIVLADWQKKGLEGLLCSLERANLSTRRKIMFTALADSNPGTDLRGILEQ